MLKAWSLLVWIGLFMAITIGSCAQVIGIEDLPPLQPVCGNGELEEGETCDDGNRLLGDGCDIYALICGNGFIDPAGDELCDGGDRDEDGHADDTPGCDYDCTLPECGDGIINAAVGENCEDDADCSLGGRCGGASCTCNYD